MFSPDGSDNEFIEIYNLSETDTIDLAGYRIIYYTSSPDLITFHEAGTKLLPNSFAVIFEGDYNFNDDHYGSLIPKDALVLKIDNKAFGSSGMSNSSDRSISVVSPEGDTVDTYTYSANNSAGYSDEKITLSGDNSESNWLNSRLLNGTPGNSNSVSPKQFDLVIKRIIITPEIVFEGGNAEVLITIFNEGLKEAYNFTVELYEDTDADSSGSTGELLFLQEFNYLQAGDSLSVSHIFYDLQLRDYNLMCIVSYYSDEDTSNNFYYYSFKPNPEPDDYNDIVINEIMHSPAPGEPEWIELYNRSENPISIEDWRVKDRSTSAGITDESFSISSNEYLVITEDESIHDHFNISSKVIISANLPSLNNSGDNIVLLDSLDRVIDSVSYNSNWGGSGGISLERISPDSASNDSANWASSITISRATPGIINSVTRKEFDAGFSRIIVSPEKPIEEGQVNINATVINFGTNTANQFTVNFYSDINLDSLAQTSEFISSETITNLFPDDSVTSSIIISGAVPGYYNYIIIIEYPEDQFSENNVFYANFTVYERPAEFNDIVINEIMYKPRDDEPEWIELYNNSRAAWDLTNWLISDKSSSAYISDSVVTIVPGGYIVLSDDESLENYYDIPGEMEVLNLPSLNNSGDNLKIIDNLGRIIDSVNYKSSWSGGISEVSLERRLPYHSSNDSTNWSGADTLVNATPGTLNSVTPREFDLAISNFYLLNEFRIVGSQLNAVAVVKNIGINTITESTLELTHIVSNIYESFHISDLNELSAGDSVQVEFEIRGFDEGDNLYRLEITTPLDDKLSNNYMELSFTGIIINEQPGDIVLNEIMYAPAAGEPEWIEIYNRSNKTINLENYKLADDTDTTVVIDKTLYLAGEEYFVFAKDSSFISRYETDNYIITPFPNLSNSGDKVILLNYINGVIDSLSFSNNWGGRNGLSLERIDPVAFSSDSTNWQSAKVDSGGTPGIINTVSRKEIDVAVTGVLFNPEFPLAGDDVVISTIIKNVGKASIYTTLTLYENITYDNLSTQSQIVDHIDNINLVPGDSALIDFNYRIQNIERSKNFLVVADTNGDQDSTNNYKHKSISPGYRELMVVINEIHYNPTDGEPEWFELYNNSNKLVDLADWKVSDVFTTPKIVAITNEELLISPNEFLVVTKDSSVFDYHATIPCRVVKINFANLNNDTDGLVIKDANGTLIDSMIYKSSGSTGYSIERIDVNSSNTDSTNWRTSIDIEKSSPGRINTVVQKTFDLTAVEIILDPEFPVINEFVIPAMLIRNIGKENATNFSVNFHYSQNDVNTDLNSITGLSLNSGDSVIVTSRDEFQLNTETVVYSEIIFSNDNDLSNNLLSLLVQPGVKKKAFIITEFMALPNQGKSEWIELFNNSSEPVNIYNWSLSDVLSIPTKGIITTDTVIINPGEYFVIAKDTLGLNITTNTKLFQTNFGGLGNTEDGIILYDFRNAIIDSLFYDRTWMLKRGKSLERISNSANSGSSLNWTLSLSEAGCTPGLENSISSAQGYDRNSVVINEFMYNPAEGNCEFIELLNISDSIVNIGGWQHTDDEGNVNLVSDINYNLEPGNYFIAAADSSIFLNYPDLIADQVSILNKADMGLPNSGESIILKDIFGNVVDSLFYSDKWHNRNIKENKNLSLERISPIISSYDPTNWSTCVNGIGATPGLKNSVYTPYHTAESKISISPNPFSPDNDGFEDFTIITYNLKSPVNQLRIKIFDDRGRKVRTLTNNLASGASGSIIFDGLDDEGNPLKIGMYIIFVETVGQNSNVIENYKKVVVVARKF